MADAAVQGASVFKRLKLKPSIKTVNRKVIVKDEFVNFLAIKIKTLSQYKIVLLTANRFYSDKIESSKKALFDLCPTTQWNDKPFCGHVFCWHWCYWQYQNG